MPARALLPDGIELHYLERGRGQPLLLLHGGMGDCHSWAHQLDTFAERFRVIACSRRHSSPNRNRGATMQHPVDVDVDDLMAFARVLRIGPAHLVATSYGALVALAHAVRDRGRVLSLVLAEPPLHRWACGTPAGAALYEAFVNDVWQPAARAFDRGRDRDAIALLVNGMWGRPVFASLPPERAAAALRNATAMQVLTHAADPFPDLPRTDVARIQVPTLLLHGEHASALHVRGIEALAGVMPHASRAIIRGAGHASPVENPEGFNAAVLRFLAKHT
jgi:pimeloyl-ACP methyl ester carboxylesterase